MRVLLVRHAQTIENAEQRFQGHIHGRLSDLGVRQIVALGRALKDEKIDYFFGSPLDRARRTLEAVRMHHRHLTAVFTDELKERGKGVWEGWRFADAFKKDALLEDKFRDARFRPDGGESLLDVRRRVRRFLKSLCMVGREDTVFVAGHGVLNGELFRILLKSDAHFSQANACINEFWMDPDTVYLMRLNDTAHLRDLPSVEESIAALRGSSAEAGTPTNT